MRECCGLHINISMVHGSPVVESALLQAAKAKNAGPYSPYKSVNEGMGRMSWLYYSPSMPPARLSRLSNRVAIPHMLSAGQPFANRLP